MSVTTWEDDVDGLLSTEQTLRQECVRLLRETNAAQGPRPLAPRHTIQVELPELPALPPAPVLPARRQASLAAAARLAEVLFGDDSMHRNMEAFRLLSALKKEQGAFLHDRDFPMVKRVVDQVWDTNHLHHMQRDDIRATFDRRLVDQLLADEELLSALRKCMTLCFALRQQWSERFLRAHFGPFDTAGKDVVYVQIPYQLAGALKSLFNITRQEWSPLQHSMYHEMTTVERETLKRLGNNDLGNGFEECARRYAYRTVRHPPQRQIDNATRVMQAAMMDFEVEGAARVHALLAGDRQMFVDEQQRLVRRASQQSLRITHSYPQSVANLTRALSCARNEGWVDADLVEARSEEVFAALPAWGFLLDARDQVQRGTDTVTLAHVTAEIFHDDACRAAAQAVLDAINALPQASARAAILTDTLATLAAAEPPDAQATTRRLRATLRRLSNDVIVSDRELYADICLRAF